MPSNTANYIDGEATGGANSIPPSRFGGNVDDWRIGKGGTMYYQCEVSFFFLFNQLPMNDVLACFEDMHFSDMILHFLRIGRRLLDYCG